MMSRTRASQNRAKRRRQRRNRRLRNQTCPIHGSHLRPAQTAWGVKYECPQAGCTVAAWSGSTSTPADQATRTARRQAHHAFDQLWRHDKSTRTAFYRLLAGFMGIEMRDCHIGYFSAAQCARVLEFVERMQTGVSA